MKKPKDRIPDGVLKKIFPKKFNRSPASETVYMQLKQMILSGKFRKGQRLLRENITQDCMVSEMIVSKAFLRLKKDRLVITKNGVGSFIA